MCGTAGTPRPAQAAGILPAQVRDVLNCSTMVIPCSEGELKPTPLAVKCHLALSRAAVPLRGQCVGDTVCVQVQAGSLQIRNLLQEM